MQVKTLLESYREEMAQLPREKLREIRKIVYLNYGQCHYKTHENLMYKHKLRILAELIESKS